MYKTFKRKNWKYPSSSANVDLMSHMLVINYLRQGTSNKCRPLQILESIPETATEDGSCVTNDRIEQNSNSATHNYNSPTSVMDQSLSYASENERFAFSFLERYGEMIHAQEVEDNLTISHVRPIFQTIQRLGGALDQRQSGNENEVSVKETSFTANADDTYMLATSRQGITNDSIVSTPPQSSVATSVSYDDKLTFETMQRFQDRPLILSMDDSKDYEVLKTDQQLCLVLKTIVESGSQRDQSPDAGITFAEFVHVYKIAVSGMQALQMLPSQGSGKVSDKDRKRTWGRCLVMMQSFSQFDLERIEVSNASIVTNDEKDVQVVERIKSLEDFEGREMEVKYSKTLELVREREAQIARLMNEVSAKKRRSNVLLYLSLLALAISVGLGCYLFDHWQLGTILAEVKESKNIVEPVANNNDDSALEVSENLVGDLVITLADTQEQLNAAKTQVGSMVLDMAKVNNQLAACLSAQAEPSQMCPDIVPSPEENSKTTDIKLGESEGLLAPHVRRQITTAAGTAAIMLIPSFLPVKLVQRFGTIFARFAK